MNKAFWLSILGDCWEKKYLLLTPSKIDGRVPMQPTRCTYNPQPATWYTGRFYRVWSIEGATHPVSGGGGKVRRQKRRINKDCGEIQKLSSYQNFFPFIENVVQIFVAW